MWTIEVNLLNVGTGEREVITHGDTGDLEMVLKLAGIRARFAYKGARYHSDAPTVDPIARKLIYYCEGYPDS